jgi:hypothetical protein
MSRAFRISITYAIEPAGGKHQSRFLERTKVIIINTAVNWI